MESEKRKRPQDFVEGKTKRYATGCGDVYVTLNEVDGSLFEVFLRMGKSGGCAMAQVEALGRILSAALRLGFPPQEAVRQLKGISCQSGGWDEGGEGKILSCPDAVGRAVEWWLRHNGVEAPGEG